MFIEYNNLLFQSDSPTGENIINFITELKNKNIKHVIRLCMPLYCSHNIKVEQINFYDWKSDNIYTPSKQIIKDWIKLLDTVKTPILVHCSKGLGRSSVLIGIALIKNGMSNEDAINTINNKYEPLNPKQILFLSEYKNKTRYFASCILSSKKYFRLN